MLKSAVMFNLNALSSHLQHYKCCRSAHLHTRNSKQSYKWAQNFSEYQFRSHSTSLKLQQVIPEEWTVIKLDKGIIGV
jgi:hypothetical protein